MRASVLREWRLLLVAASLCWLTGCLGGSQNPSYFPYLCPPGDIIPTHAKPPGLGYYANFDPNAVRLEVRPTSAINPVGTQHVVIATVYDGQGKPRRSRRVEWALEGKGSIIEVDESGQHPGRGYLDGPHRAVSFTNYFTHQMTRGNLDPKDDFVLRPGQTWCVVSSAVEGDTYVTAYAPGVSNWDKRLTTVNMRWVDAGWVFPANATARAGSQHVLTTQVFRHTNKEPLADYRVRYRIVGGPPALLLPSQTQETVVVSDLKGLAQVAIAQKAPMPGASAIEVEIIRPPDPTQPTGSGVVVAKAVTTVEWLAPSISLTHSGPPSAGIGQPVNYVIEVINTGKIESQSMTVTNPVPAGLAFINADPPAFLAGKVPTWTLGVLPPGQKHTIKVLYQAEKIGMVNNCAFVETEEGLKDEKCIATEITEPRLGAKLTGPNKAAVGEVLDFTVTLDNPGGGPADGVKLTAYLSKGLEAQGLKPEEKDTRVITAEQGMLKPLEQRVIPLKVVAIEPGKQSVQVVAVAAGGLKAETAPHVVDVIKPALSVSLNGPKKKYVDRPAEWNITVSNDSDIPLNNVMVKDILPPQLQFESATGGGSLNEKNEVVWDIGPLGPMQKRVLQLTTRSGKTPALVNNTVVATAEYGLQKEATASLVIEGVPALKLEAIDVGDPVELGKEVMYQIEVTNTGSESVTGLGLVAQLPPELKLVNAIGVTANSKTNTAKGEVITFAKLPALEPGKVAKYQIKATAEKPGDVRFRVDIFADTLKGSVFEEESTTIIGPSALPNAPPIPVPGFGAAAPPEPPPAAAPPATPVLATPTPPPAPPAPAPGVAPSTGGVPMVPPPAFPADAKPLPKG